jgi:DNA-binding XRE family transcriptional regulator
MATRDLDRLAKNVKAHRMEYFASRKAAADTAGISKDTWQRVEEGAEVRESTYAKIDKALGWATGSCLAIAEGGNPVFVQPAAGGSSATAAPTYQRLTADAVRRAAFEAARAKMPAAPIGDIDAFSDELVEVLRRTGDIEDTA